VYVSLYVHRGKALIIKRFTVDGMIDLEQYDLHQYALSVICVARIRFAALQ
jgi:hypothetical protein